MAAGDGFTADRAWREHLGWLEVQMGRTGSVERLTPDPKAGTALP
jgi:hypothetical protein